MIIMLNTCHVISLNHHKIIKHRWGQSEAYMYVNLHPLQYIHVSMILISAYNTTKIMDLQSMQFTFWNVYHHDLEA